MLRQRQTLVYRLEPHGALAGMPARVAIIGRDADAVGLIMSNMSGAMPVPPAFDPMARAVDRRVQ